MPTGTLPKLIGAPSRDARRASPGPLPGDGGSPRWTNGTRSTWPDRRTLPSVARTAVNLRFSPSKPISTCATAREMAPTAPSSPGKASMTVPPPAAAAGPLWGAPAVWSVTSSSTKGMTPASSPNASDFFNSLLSGSLSPTAAGAQQIENGVHRRPHFGLARPPTGPRRRDHWLQPPTARDQTGSLAVRRMLAPRMVKPLVFDERSSDPTSNATFFDTTKLSVSGQRSRYMNKENTLRD